MTRPGHLPPAAAASEVVLLCCRTLMRMATLPALGPALREAGVPAAVTRFRGHADLRVADAAQSCMLLLDEKAQEAKEAKQAEGSRYDDGTKYDVFLSHKRSDAKDFARALYNLLELRGIHTFLDYEYRDELEGLGQMVGSSTNFIFIMTDNIFESQWCMRELEAAIDKDRNIILVTKEGSRWKDAQGVACQFPPASLLERLPEKVRAIMSRKAIAHSDEYYQAFVDNLMKKIKVGPTTGTASTPSTQQGSAAEPAAPLTRHTTFSSHAAAAAAARHSSLTGGPGSGLPATGEASGAGGGLLGRRDEQCRQRLWQQQPARGGLGTGTAGSRRLRAGSVHGCTSAAAAAAAGAGAAGRIQHLGWSHGAAGRRGLGLGAAAQAQQQQQHQQHQQQLLHAAVASSALETRQQLRLDHLQLVATMQAQLAQSVQGLALQMSSRDGPRMDELAREMRDVKQRLASVESLCQRTLQAAEQVAHLLQQQQYQGYHDRVLPPLNSSPVQLLHMHQQQQQQRRSSGPAAFAGLAHHSALQQQAGVDQQLEDWLGGGGSHISLPSISADLGHGGPGQQHQQQHGGSAAADLPAARGAGAPLHARNGRANGGGGGGNAGMGKRASVPL